MVYKPTNISRGAPSGSPNIMGLSENADAQKIGGVLIYDGEPPEKSSFYVGFFRLTIQRVISSSATEDVFQHGGLHLFGASVNIQYHFLQEGSMCFFFRSCE